MSKSDAVAFINEIQMGIDLQDVDRTGMVKGIDAGDVDRMIAPDHQWQSAGFESSANSGFYVGVALDRVGVDDIGIAKIDDPDIGAKVDPIILVVVSASMAKLKQGRCIANCARAKPRAATVLSPGIKGGAQNRDIRLYLRPVLDVGPFPECRDSDKGQVKPPAFIPVFTHKTGISAEYCGGPVVNYKKGFPPTRARAIGKRQTNPPKE